MPGRAQVLRRVVRRVGELRAVRRPHELVLELLERVDQRIAVASSSAREERALWRCGTTRSTARAGTARRTGHAPGTARAQPPARRARRDGRRTARRVERPLERVREVVHDATIRPRTRSSPDGSRGAGRYAPAGRGEAVDHAPARVAADDRPRQSSTRRSRRGPGPVGGSTGPGRRPGEGAFRAGRASRPPPRRRRRARP